MVEAATCAGFFISILATSVLAQDATQGVTVTPGPVPAEECKAEAVSTDFLGILVQTPLAAGTPEVFTEVPSGSLLDAQTTAEIVSAVRQFVGCYNTGNTLRLLNLYDREYLRRLFDPQGTMPADTADDLIASLSKPQPPAANEQLSLVAIRTLVQLADGRVAVVLETDGGNPNPDGTDVDLFVFKKLDGRWLIDDAVKDIDKNFRQTPTAW